MVIVLYSEAVRDHLALLSCETSVNSAGNESDVRLYQITSATEGGNGSFCHYRSLNSTCPCKTGSVASSTTKALFLMRRERGALMEKDCVGYKVICDTEGTCLFLNTVLLPLAHRDWREWFGLPRRKQQCFSQLWIPVTSKPAECISFIFKYFMTILMLLYSPCVGACAEDGLSLEWNRPTV